MNLELLQNLYDPFTALVWDVMNGRVTETTIQLALLMDDEALSESELDFVKCIANGNPDYPPIDEARALLEELEECYGDNDE